MRDVIEMRGPKLRVNCEETRRLIILRVLCDMFARINREFSIYLLDILRVQSHRCATKECRGTIIRRSANIADASTYPRHMSVTQMSPRARRVSRDRLIKTKQ
ncbi:hypothetical protein PUN28_010530 [Cardiocondyla obscurior]|uniref:Uncharacterized protein n=1 Tax=Cardiocondyla obscurior TaxID=286306 RepID=A0AAW2FIY6_9HYME